MPPLTNMRNIILLTTLLITNYCLAQCPFTVSLSLKGSVCFGADTLVVKSANKLAVLNGIKMGCWTRRLIP